MIIDYYGDNQLRFIIIISLADLYRKKLYKGTEIYIIYKQINVNVNK